MVVTLFSRQAKLAGVPVKQLVLAALVLQNAALAILLHYSRTMPLVGGGRYYPSTAVFLSEVIKFAFFLSMALYDIARSPQTPDTSTIGELSNALSRAVFTGDSWKLAIPAALYTLQNSLQYVAASNLAAPTFSLTFQTKVLTTAILGVVLLGRKLSLQKWMSLVLLTFGVVTVVVSSLSQQEGVLSIQDLKEGVSFHAPRNIWDLEAEGSEAAGQLNKRSATYEGIDEDFAAANPRLDTSIGLAAAGAACLLSGIAGVYFERLLNNRGEFKASIWVRNVQMSFYSLWPTLFLGVFFLDGEYLSKTGFFTGYNWAVWSVIVLQALGGVMVALTLNFADNTTKTLATSISAFMVFLASAIFMKFHTTVPYFVGMAATLLAAYLYVAVLEEKKPRAPPINVSQFDKSSESGYFDRAPSASVANPPLRDPIRDALSTSRPSTPVSERRHIRTKSSEVRLTKREQY